MALKPPVNNEYPELVQKALDALTRHKIAIEKDSTSNLIKLSVEDLNGIEGYGVDEQEAFKNLVIAFLRLSR